MQSTGGKGSIVSTSPASRGTVILRKNEERRLLAGHKWVFSNEVLRLEGGGPAPLVVDVSSSAGRFLGTGLYNPHSLIAVRLLDGTVREFSDYLSARMEEAVRIRRLSGKMGPDSAERLIHSESDGLPGLVVDRYGDLLAVQITTLAMEAYADQVLSILSDLLSPRGVRVERRTKAREIEGLPVEEDLLVGTVPERVQVRIGGALHHFSLRDGQKTGLFLDQKDNIERLSPFLDRPNVLDAFCYVGAWSIGLGGLGRVQSVTGVDASAAALAFYAENTQAIGKKILPVCANFLEWGEKEVESGRRYDAIIVDPPAFIKSRRLIKEGLEGYYRVFRLATALLEPEGVLVACSCSALLEWEDLTGILRSVFRKEHKKARLFYQGRASWDHPRLLAMPELDYLKCAAFFVGAE